MLKAVLVDFDGTLVDTAQANAGAYARALSESGFRYQPADIAPMIHGRSWKDFLPELAPGADASLHLAVALRKRALFPDYFHQTKPNRILIDLLGQWRLTMRLGLVTTASRAGVDALLDYHKLRELFNVIVCGDDVTENKPAPDAYFKAAFLLGASPDTCLVIEDSDTGVAAGKAFGGHVVRWVSAII